MLVWFYHIDSLTNEQNFLIFVDGVIWGRRGCHSLSLSLSLLKKFLWTSYFKIYQEGLTYQVGKKMASAGMFGRKISQERSRLFLVNWKILLKLGMWTPLTSTYIYIYIYIYIVTNRLSLGLRKQARNENLKKYI